MRFLARLILHKIQKLVVIGMIACLCFGVSGVWHGWRHAQPTEVVLSENTAQGLPKHVTLKNVALSPMDSITLTEFGTSTVYLPIRARGAAQSDKIFLLLKSNNREFLALSANPKAKSAGFEAIKAVVLAAAKISDQTTVTGMVENDFNLSTREKTALRKALPALDRDFSVINEGEKPSIASGIGLLVAAAALFAALGLCGAAPDKSSAEPPLLNANALPPLLNEPPILKPDV